MSFCTVTTGVPSHSGTLEVELMTHGGCDAKIAVRVRSKKSPKALQKSHLRHAFNSLRGFGIEVALHPNITSQTLVTTK